MNFEQVANTHETTVTPKTSESLEYRKTTRHLGGILALVAALESTPAQAQAIEIEPTTSFETAVTTTLHENVLRGDNEIYAPFIKSEDNTIEQWLPIITGKTSEVEISPAEIAKQIVEAAEESGVNEVTFCNIHTHPLASALAHNDLTAEEVTAIQQGKFSISLPPSPSDVNPLMHRMSDVAMHEVISQAGSDIKITRVNAVVDPLGITYFHNMSANELAEKYPTIHEESVSLQESYDAIEVQLQNLMKILSDTELQRLYEEFDDLPEVTSRFEIEYVLPLYLTGRDLKNIPALNSLATEYPAIIEILSGAERLQITQDEQKIVTQEALEDWINLSMAVGIDAKILRESQEYKGLLELYAASGVALRLVGYDELANELACAGVDYKATE